MRACAGSMVALLLVIGMVAGCRSKGAHAAGAPARTQAQRKPAAQVPGTLYTDKSHGFSLRYPAGWTRRQDSDKDDVLVVDAKANDPAGVELTVSVPDLGAHIPGLIPLGAVQSGYVKDLKKRLHEVSVEDSAAPSVNGASATRRFTASGIGDKGKRKLDVALLVKGDHLYILSAEAPMKDFARAKTALDQALTTWKWNGK